MRSNPALAAGLGARAVGSKKVCEQRLPEYRQLVAKLVSAAKQSIGGRHFGFAFNPSSTSRADQNGCDASRSFSLEAAGCSLCDGPPRGSGEGPGHSLHAGCHKGENLEAFCLLSPPTGSVGFLPFPFPVPHHFPPLCAPPLTPLLRLAPNLRSPALP